MAPPPPVDPDALWTRSIAVAGFSVALLTFVWTLVRDWRDRGKLELTAMIGKFAPSADPKSYLVVTITNVGRRPVFVKGWGGAFKRHKSGNDHFVILPRVLPKMLGEAESVVEYSDDLESLDDNVKSIFAWDSSGKNWKLSQRRLKAVVAAAKKSLAKGRQSRTGPLPPEEDY